MRDVDLGKCIIASGYSRHKVPDVENTWSFIGTALNLMLLEWGWKRCCQDIRGAKLC